MKKWYKFVSMVEFNDWHNEKKNELGLPKKSVNNNGFINEDAIETTSVTELYEVGENDFRAMIDETMADNLLETENPYQSNYAKTL